MPTVSRKKLRPADQLPDLAAGHLQGPVRTVTQRTDHLLSLVSLLKQTRWRHGERLAQRRRSRSAVIVWPPASVTATVTCAALARARRACTRRVSGSVTSSPGNAPASVTV